jgi:hypothetical protein
MRGAGKAQSAMEYLMTYGWAILVVAVALAALYQLGVFSGPATPKAQPGSCRVIKDGTGATETISLAGECNNQEPEFLPVFNGGTSYANTPLIFPSGSSQTNFTLSVWIDVTGNCQANNFYCGVVDADNGVSGWGLMAGTANVDFWVLASTPGTVQDMKLPVPTSQWVNIVVTYQSGGLNGNYVANGYVNGTNVDPGISRSPITLPEPFPLEIGMARQNSQMVFNGGIADIQIYNASLSQSEITALYQEGIGGVPIRPQNLVAWWPLNQNFNDYSGNNNDGQAVTGITFSSTWSKAYTPP